MRGRRRLRRLLAGVRDRLDRLEREVTALAIVLRDPRTPWYARAVVGLTLGLAASPIDPIPDFVPVLGYLDDAVFVPLGVALALRLTPTAVFEEARARADDADAAPWTRWVVAALVLLAWAVVAAVVAGLLWSRRG